MKPQLFKINQAFFIKLGKFVFFAGSLVVSSHWAWPYIDSYFTNLKARQNQELINQFQAAINAAKYETIQYVNSRMNTVESNVNTRLDQTNSVLKNHIIKSTNDKEEIIMVVEKLYPAKKYSFDTSYINLPLKHERFNTGSVK